MNRQIKKTTVVLLAAGCIAGTAQAEFGVSAGGSFNYKADFRSAVAPQPRPVDPGKAVAGTEHVYDDGYNRVDSSGNAGNQTTYWGYQNVSQDNGGSVTMNSSRSIINANGSSGTQNDAQPAIEVYWQEDLTENETWNIGLLAALRWQRIDLDNQTVYSTIIETISDTYSYVGILPGAPFDGSFTGPNFLLSDTPNRNTTYASGADLIVTRTFNADLIGFDIGPTLSWNLSEKLSLSAFAGGTVAWIKSDFSYCDGTFESGSVTDDDWLFGGIAGVDLQYQFGEHWGLFVGAAYTYLEDFSKKIDGRSAELQFDDSYTLRSGIFFQ